MLKIVPIQKALLRKHKNDIQPIRLDSATIRSFGGKASRMNGSLETLFNGILQAKPGTTVKLTAGQEMPFNVNPLNAQMA